MKEFDLSIEDLNLLFIACVGEEKRNPEKFGTEYRQLQKQLKDLSKMCDRFNDFTLKVTVDGYPNQELPF